MAFNPVLARTGFGDDNLVPLAMANERLILKRDGVHLDMKITGKKYSGKGTMFLSNFRLVFLKEGKLTSHKGWSSAEFPLGTMYGPGGSGEPPKFQQPIFGANYLDGVSPPLEQASHPFGAASLWQLTFKNGGCARFVKIFYTVHAAAKRSTQAAQETADHLLVHNGAAAFVDPTDPSIIFIQQPVPQEQFQYSQNGYIPMTPVSPPPRPPPYQAPPYQGPPPGQPPYQGPPPGHPPYQAGHPPYQGPPPPYHGHPPYQQGPYQGQPPPYHPGPYQGQPSPYQQGPYQGQPPYHPGPYQGQPPPPGQYFSEFNEQKNNR